MKWVTIAHLGMAIGALAAIGFVSMICNVILAGLSYSTYLTLH